MNQAMSVLTSQQTDEWYTPPHIIERARRVMGSIDLDPATTLFAQSYINAQMSYTRQGLERPWYGTVWLNPPFSNTPKWIAYALDQYEQGNATQMCILVNSAPGYNWYESLLDRATISCMLRTRLSFLQHDGTIKGAAKKGQTISYLGHAVDSFLDTFDDLGRFIEGTR